MSRSSDMNLFFEKIMHLSVSRLGGAVAGVLGSYGADNDILNSLKKSVVAFAIEYRKPTRSSVKLEQLSNDIDGFLQTLQLTNTLSHDEANKLIDQLQKLVDNASV